MKDLSLVGKALCLAFCISSSLAQEVEFRSTMSEGQGYNTFLDRAQIHGAVITNNNAAASTKRSEGPGDQPTTADYPFTWPRPVDPDVNAYDYFNPSPEDEPENLTEKSEAEKDDENANQKGRVDNMNIPGQKRRIGTCQAELESHIEFVSDYTSYLQALGVNVAATISGYGQKASISGSYLDESTFSSNSLTYIASISINKQRQDSNKGFTFNTTLYETLKGKRPFATTFGNRWIQGFQRGGKMMARITFKFDESSNKQEIKAQAEASLAFWGTTTEISTEVNKTMESLSKKAQVQVNIFYQGKIGGELHSQAQSSDDGKATALQILANAKSRADEFESQGCDHDYTYQSVLDSYLNIGNFPTDQKIPSYTAAGARAYHLLGDMVKHTELRETLRQLRALNEAEEHDIQEQEIDLIEAQKKWIRDTAENPENATETVKELFKLSREFYGKWKPYLTVQRSPLEIKAGYDVTENDPDTKQPTTYSCTKWFEAYDPTRWTWGKVRFCLPRRANVFSLTVLRQDAQYFWGAEWSKESEKYPAYVTVSGTVKRIGSTTPARNFGSKQTTAKLYNTVAEEEKLIPGKYEVEVNFHQDAPFWHDKYIREVFKFEFEASLA